MKNGYAGDLPVNDHPDRRTFLSQTIASVATVAATQNTNRCLAGRPNEKLVIALIGCGGRGKHDAGIFQRTHNVELKYVCDVDKERSTSAAKSLNVPSSGIIHDMRRAFDDKSVDAVLITTPDHWHSPAAILACQAGKHVYVEKPISHNVREGRLLVDTSQRTKMLVQHGTQSRSTRMMIEAVRRLREGIIGQVKMAKCWNVQRRSVLGPGEDTSPPAGFDYDNWVGPATMIPYRTNRVHNRWTMWYHFGAGDMGNDGVHDLDYARWGLGVNSHPTRISGHGGKYHFEDDTEFPDTQQVTFEYPDGTSPKNTKLLIYEQRLWSSNFPHNCDSGAEFYGDRGEMFLSRRGKIEVRGDRNVAVPVDIEPGAQDDVAHVFNFCESIRGNAQLNADAMTGHLSTSLCHLGNIATRLGRTLTFDPATEQIVGDVEANAFIRREYRDHWATPVSL